MSRSRPLREDFTPETFSEAEALRKKQEYYRHRARILAAYHKKRNSKGEDHLGALS
jgi:hypothetical protein